MEKNNNFWNLEIVERLTFCDECPLNLALCLFIHFPNQQETKFCAKCKLQNYYIHIKLTPAITTQSMIPTQPVD